MKIKLLISYQGTHFYGWQKQKNERTIQEELEKALFQLFQTSISVVGSGRTDTGVHALGQVAHFEIPKWKNIPLLKALNHLTPQDICIIKAWRAPEEFHARFSAIKKTYSFLLSTTPFPQALAREFVWWTSQKIQLKKLQQQAKKVVGTQDFTSFQSSGSEVKTTVKTIYSAQWKQIQPHLYQFDITGSGFLKQMVRNLVGTQLDLLKEPFPEKKLQYILEKKDRKLAYSTAPGQGLFLNEVFYPKTLDKKCLSI